MYEYTFVKIKISIWTSKPKQPLEDVIREYAKKGWRLVQVLGGAPYNDYEIIFERLI